MILIDIVAKKGKKEIFTPEHKAIARKIAAETFVLLKNEGNLLPLQKRVKLLWLALWQILVVICREHGALQPD